MSLTKVHVGIGSNRPSFATTFQREKPRCSNIRTTALGSKGLSLLKRSRTTYHDYTTYLRPNLSQNHIVYWHGIRSLAKSVSSLFLRSTDLLFT
jgi:hypothetical protein